jgi:cytochrome c556
VPGLAEDAPSKPVTPRIANFRKIGKAFKFIRDQLKTDGPPAASIQESAQQIEVLGGQILTWFPAGPDGKSRAKPQVWTDRPAFEQAHKKFYVEAQKMSAAAHSGDHAAIVAQFKLLGATCKDCHQRFRE